LARFEELQPQTRRLENAASRADDRLVAYFAARDWDAATETLTDDYYSDDRRHVVNVGLQHGRDVAIANMKTSVDLRITFGKSEVIATRGERLILSRARWSGPDQRPEAFHTEVLSVVEVNADERVAARVMFDANDIDAAFAELDARYLAGEAAAHSQTWSVIAGAHAGVNRHELPATTPDPGYIDHRPLVSIEGDLAASLRAVWDITSHFRVYIEAVHRLRELGAVATQVMKGTSQQGFDAEWRMIGILTVEGRLISRAEVFDEADLDAALARFEELHPQAPRPENAASQVEQRFSTYFAARNWDAISELIADDFSMDDRRHTINAGVRHGRAAEIASLRAIADVGVTSMAPTVIAIRGGRLALGSYFVSDGWGGTEALCVLEINGDNQIVARVGFDPDDLDAAIAELDARYLAGEAAAHAHTWSVNSGFYAAFNRHELPATTPDWVYIDHRPLITIEASDLPASIRTVWDLTPNMSVYMEAVHQLSDLGAVVTSVVHGTSQEGFDAERRMVNIFTVDGDLLSRVDVFDEADLDAALARFDELDRPASS
jgi:hypothetical protein